VNHLGDTNKMVDTPRTEAEVNRQKCWSDDLITIDANFAAQLERELNEMERLAAVRLSYIKLIEAQNDAANDRIKKLEDRIHRAANAFFADASDKYASVQMLAILEEERWKK
jgi:hypothetical protein